MGIALYRTSASSVFAFFLRCISGVGVIGVVGAVDIFDIVSDVVEIVSDIQLRCSPSKILCLGVK